MQFLSLQYKVLAAYGDTNFVSVGCLPPPCFCETCRPLALTLALQVDAIQEHYLHQTGQPFVVHCNQVPAKTLLALYSGLLPAKNTSECYEIFLSYRHGKLDSEMAAVLWNSLSDFALGEEGRHVAVFWDVKSVETGVQFDTSFMVALSTALMFSPLITPHALEQMAMPGSQNKLDHVLLEWWLALTLFWIPGFPVIHIVPIFCGKVWHSNSMRC